MDLKSRLQGYFSSKLERLSADLASKHGMTSDEAEDLVRDFLKEAPMGLPRGWRGSYLKRRIPWSSSLERPTVPFARDLNRPF
jgi:hypothetical protein